MQTKFPTSHQPPRWWPHNEPWPPAGMRGRMMRGHFFRRIGCLFFSFTLLVAMIFTIILSLVAQALGFLQLPDLSGWTFILGFLLLLIGLAALSLVGRWLRRVSTPLGELLEAAEKVSHGDYSARVTERGPSATRQLSNAFNQMAARLQDTDQQRRGLLADVTHELRTPLTILQGNLEGMLDGVYPPDETNLRSLLEETHILSRLVDDLRTLSLAESGALQLNLEPVDLALLVDETLASFRSQAGAAGVTLEFAPAAEPPVLEIDPERMRQVLANLIANALRYTPSGGTIRARLASIQEQSKPFAILEIQDSGPGILAADLPHVFDRFYKSRDSGGMGLGLAIAKKLVEAHHGSIQAESQPGQGTTIRISLPC